MAQEGGGRGKRRRKRCDHLRCRREFGQSPVCLKVSTLTAHYSLFLLFFFFSSENFPDLSGNSDAIERNLKTFCEHMVGRLLHSVVTAHLTSRH